MISIIICTCNRAAHLEETLVAMEGVQVPEGAECELLIVDNGSTDNTRAVVEATILPQMSIRYFYEAKKGQSNARNTGMSQAKGDVFLWTDDDVRSPQNWIEAMCNPIMAGEADVVSGGVKMARHLERPWQTELHHGWFAVAPTQYSIDGFVGANMAFSRRVLQQIPAFDVELGPGQIGFGDETLFALQLKIANYRFKSAWETKIEHHFDAARMQRNDLLVSGHKRGAASAYISYHWEHLNIADLSKKLLKRKLRLRFERVRRRNEGFGDEGLPDWETRLVSDIGYLVQFQKESYRPRLYEKHGLVKKFL